MKKIVTITLDKELIPKLKIKLEQKSVKLSTLINKFLIGWLKNE